MPSKKRPLKQNDHILGKVKKFKNRKEVIQKVVAEGKTSKYHVLFEGVSQILHFSARMDYNIFTCTLTRLIPTGFETTRSDF